MRKTVALILAGGRGKRMDVLCYMKPKQGEKMLTPGERNQCDGQFRKEITHA
jgi:hypothetical protein